MVERLNIATGSPFEPRFGFSRAVKVDRTVFVSGCTAIQSDGTIPAAGDCYAQAVLAFETIEKALRQAGATLKDVVRTRIFATDMDQYESIERAHRELFGDIRPASTLVEVSRLIHPDMLIEIEADAVIGSDMS